MSTLPLQDMIASAIKTASAKLAAEKEPEKAKRLLDYEKREHGHIPSPNEEDEEKEHEEEEGEMKAEKKAAALCSKEHVEKLSSAIEYLSTHLDQIAAPGPIASALSKLAMKPGAGGGSAGGKSVPPAQRAGALETNESIGGKQQYRKEKAKGEQAEDGGKSPLSEARPHDGKTQLDNNMHEAPGNNHGAVPKTEYPAKGPLVAGPSGAHDRGKNGASEKVAGLAQRVLEKSVEFGTKHPHAALTAVGAGGGALAGAAGGAAGADHGHHLSGALKGGLAGGAVGGAASYGMGRAVGLHKAASVQEVARQRILMKLAGEDVMKSSIDGGGTVSPLAGKGQLRTMESGEQAPKQGGSATNGQDGNAGCSLVGSNSAAIGYTKRDAKKLVVSPLAEVLDQPALSEKHDSKLQENLRNTGKAGVKIAGVRAELQKIASAGCTCNSKGECQYCTLMTKVANMGGYGGADTAPTASAGESPDGCACGGVGECRVCKLKAAMHAAKGGHPGEAEER